MEGKMFMTIREVARTGIITEHHLRILVAQGKVPTIKAGTRNYIHYPMLCEQLEKMARESMANESGI